jgi:S1-C subfamily serine protease
MILFLVKYNIGDVLASPNVDLGQNLTSAEHERAVEIYNKVKDSVVRIDFVSQISNPRITINNEPTNMVTETGAGSGFVYDTSGKIVTNNHVIEDTTELMITLANGNRYSAKVIGADPINDLAVVQIDEVALKEEHLVPIPIADPSSLRIGEPVVAIGSPYFYTNSLSEGIISHTGRTMIDVVTGNIWVGGLIQTDTSITHGNSGGPLLNMRGEVVGVNDRIEIDYQTGTQVPGLSFAISASTMEKVIPQLITNGKYSYPWIGMGIADVDPFEAKNIGLNETRGVVVMWVTPDSPAELAGIENDDIVLFADKLIINEKSDIVDYLGHKLPGDNIILDVFRSNGTYQKVNVQIGMLDNKTAAY